MQTSKAASKHRSLFPGFTLCQIEPADQTNSHALFIEEIKQNTNVDMDNKNTVGDKNMSAEGNIRVPHIPQK